MSSKSDIIKKILYAKNKKVVEYPRDTFFEEVTSHKEARVMIYEYLVGKDINKAKAEIVTNMIMNKTIYGVKYPDNAERMIQIAMS